MENETNGGGSLVGWALRSPWLDKSGSVVGRLLLPTLGAGLRTRDWEGEERRKVSDLWEESGYTEGLGPGGFGPG